MVRRSQDSIQLLSAESDSTEGTSGYPAAKLQNTATPIRRPKFYRARPVVSSTNRLPVFKDNVRTILTLVAITVLTLWIIMLTVVASSLYKRVFEVQELTNRLSAGSQGVPEEIQKCHSLSRQLQKNQTVIFSQMDSIRQSLLNFSLLMKEVESRVSEVENRLKGSPELVNVPSHLQSLTTSIASLGSGLEDMKTTTGHLQEAQEGIKQIIQILNKNITGVNASVMGLNDTIKKQLGSSNYSSSNQETNEKLVTLLLNRISPNISRMNESLSKRIDWVSEDQKKDYKVIIDLQETSANLSSQLISLRDDVLHLSTNYSALSSQIVNLKGSVNKMTTIEGASGNQRVQDALANPIPSILNKKEDIGVLKSNSSLPNIPPPA